MSRPALTPQTARPMRSATEMRLISRLSVECVLDVIAIRRQGRHVLDVLLFAAILQANLAEISRRADLQMAYADIHDVPPDELRRPITMSALANSLGLPFETVRRHARSMAREGFCILRPDGIVIPAAVVASPENVASGAESYERVRAFYYRLADAGVLGDLPQPSVSLSPALAPLRAVGRLLVSYVLRLIDTLAPVAPDVLDRLIFLEVFRENVEDLPLDPGQGRGLTADDMTPDERRKPISVLTLAHRLGLPAETVRRRVLALIADGLCARSNGGIIVPAAALGRAAASEAIVANAANLQRLMSGLARLGVLRLWDEMRQGEGLVPPRSNPIST